MSDLIDRQVRTQMSSVDDTISRQQAIDEFQAWIDALDPNSRLYNADVSLLRRCIVELKKLPSAEPEWKRVTSDD